MRLRKHARTIVAVLLDLCVAVVVALNDADASNQWDLDSNDALDAWEFPPLKNSLATVGVVILDNGFNNLHEDLADNVLSTYNATTKESTPVQAAQAWRDRVVRRRGG